MYNSGGKFNPGESPSNRTLSFLSPVGHTWLHIHDSGCWSPGRPVCDWGWSSEPLDVHTTLGAQWGLEVRFHSWPVVVSSQPVQ